MTLDKRTIRTAPQQHFNGGYVGHNLEPELSPWPLRIAAAVAVVCIILGVTIWAPVGGTF